MRRIGRLNSEADARRFREYLGLRGIEVEVRATDAGWNVWVLDEDARPDARKELDQFVIDPTAACYVDAEAEAIRARRDELETALAARRESLTERRQRPRMPWRLAPITLLVVVLCGMAAAATNIGTNDQAKSYVRITALTQSQSAKQGLPEIRDGQLWRLVTPSFLHFDVLHLLGNVSWFYLFGRVIEQTRTRSRYVLLLLLIAVVSNLSQYLASGPNFGGLSGVDCGLFGYLWFKTQFRPESGFHLPPEHVILFAGWMLICLTGVAGSIANTAHISGLIVGMLLALPRSVPVFRSKPVAEE